MNVGAAAMIVCDRATAREFGRAPVLAIRGVTVAGGAGDVWTRSDSGYPQSVRARRLARLDEGDRCKVNKVSAAVALVVQSELKIDPARLNVDSGAIAHGHPIGATGAILITTAAHTLRRLGQSKVVISLCIGGGQGIAICIERI